MQTNQDELAIRVFCEVLERLAFMFGEPAPKEELLQNPAEGMKVSMAFAGPMKGTLTLAVPSSMCSEIAANVLGIEPDDDLAQKQSLDALKEVLNITCGQMLTALAGTTPIFNMSLPTSLEVDTQGWLAFLNEPGTLGFVVDDAPVLLRLSVGEQAA